MFYTIPVLLLSRCWFSHHTKSTGWIINTSSRNHFYVGSSRVILFKISEILATDVPHKSLSKNEVRQVNISLVVFITNNNSNCYY